MNSGATTVQYEVHGIWRDNHAPPPAISRPPITGTMIQMSA
jgi:hypothetical protein